MEQKKIQMASPVKIWDLQQYKEHLLDLLNRRKSAVKGEYCNRIKGMLKDALNPNTIDVIVADILDGKKLSYNSGSGPPCINLNVYKTPAECQNALKKKFQILFISASTEASVFESDDDGMNAQL